MMPARESGFTSMISGGTSAPDADPAARSQLEAEDGQKPDAAE